MADQRDRQPLGTGTTGAADAVHVLVAGARHVEVDHQVQAVDVQASGRHVGGNQDLHGALLEAVDGQLAVLLILLAMQHEGLELAGHQLAVEAVGLDPGIGEDDRLVVGLIAQQPVDQLFLVVVVVGGDDLLAGAFGELADGVELQVLGLLEHLGDHFAQAGAAAGGGEQQGLVRPGAGLGQALHVFGEAHVEHAVGFVQHQHLDLLQRQVAGVGVFDQPPRGADQDVHPAQHGRLGLEVLAAGDQPGLDEGELGEALDFLEGLLGQFAGRQQDHRAQAHPRLGRAVTEQAVEHGQDEGRGLAAAGLGDHPQVTPLQRRRNGRHLHRGRLDKVQLGHGFQQAFVQGELGKHGVNLDKESRISCIA